MRKPLLALSLLSACTGPSGLQATTPVTAPPTTASTSTTTSTTVTSSGGRAGVSPGAAAPSVPRTSGTMALGSPPSSPPMGRVLPDHLAAIRACESGSDYTTDTGNGYFGAYQFSAATWRSVGGTGNPAHASPAEQDRRARMLLERSGAGQWPVCGR